ncbi:hypothetical protein ACJW31_02G003300 [Castanea mollissima]
MGVPEKDPSDEDQRLLHHKEPKEFVSLFQLAETGVLSRRLDADNYETDEELKKMNFSAPGYSVVAPPTAGGYSYPLAYAGYLPAPVYTGYLPVPGFAGNLPTPGYAGYPPQQMQPQENTSKFKKFFKKLGAFFCGLVRIVSFADDVDDMIN